MHTRRTARREDRHHLEQELRKAQVVALVYSIDDPQSFDRMAEHWLPMIRQLGVNVPVVLVGNKIDLRGGSDVSNEALEDGAAPVDSLARRLSERAEILPIMSEFKVRMMCARTSPSSSHVRHRKSRPASNAPPEPV
jgi:GTPase SAR1 family protein